MHPFVPPAHSCALDRTALRSAEQTFERTVVEVEEVVVLVALLVERVRLVHADWGGKVQSTDAKRDQRFHVSRDALAKDMRRHIIMRFRKRRVGLPAYAAGQ